MLNIITDHFGQSATQTTIVAENSTLTYGSSTFLDITAVSLNAAHLNLSSDGFYLAYIYGGDLSAGLTIPLYPSYGEDPHCAIDFEVASQISS